MKRVSTVEKFTSDFAEYMRENASLFMESVFISPYQIVVLNETYNHRVLMIIKHDPKEVDRKIQIIESKNFNETLKKVDSEILTDKYWLQNDVCVRLAGQLNQILRTPTPTSAKMPSWRGSHYLRVKEKPEITDALLSFLLDFENTSVEALLRKGGFLLRKAPVKEEEKKETAGAVKKTNVPVGAMWYPPFIFDDEVIGLREKFVFESNYKGYKIYFNNQSLIFLNSPLKEPEESFQKEVAQLFNEIIAVAQIYEIEGGTVSNRDVMNFEYDEKFENLISRGYNPSSSVRSLIVEDVQRRQSIYEFSEHFDFKRYKKTLFNEVLRSGEKITKNKSATDYLLSFLDAKTHFLIEQYKTSFLLAWIVLEKYIDAVWEETLVSRKISDKRIKKLARSSLWTADDKLETLNLMDLFVNERYNEVIRLKKIRNNIVHEGRNVTKQEAEECLRFSLGIIKEVVRNKCFVETDIRI